MKIFNEQHEMFRATVRSFVNSEGASTAPSDASPSAGLRRQSRRSNAAERRPA